MDKKLDKTGWLYGKLTKDEKEYVAKYSKQYSNLYVNEYLSQFLYESYFDTDAHNIEHKIMLKLIFKEFIIKKKLKNWGKWYDMGYDSCLTDLEEMSLEELRLIQQDIKQIIKRRRWI